MADESTGGLAEEGDGVDEGGVGKGVEFVFLTDAVFYFARNTFWIIER